MGTVCRIHREIFSFAWSHIAGTYRGENLEITDSHHHPPHYTEVPGLMENADEELAEKLEAVHMAEGTIRDEVIDEESAVGAIDHVIKTAAWLHHVITYIHPFSRVALCVGVSLSSRFFAAFMITKSCFVISFRAFCIRLIALSIYQDSQLFKTPDQSMS